MPMYRLHLEWDDEYESRDKAKEDLVSIWHELEGLAEGEATLHVIDVQQLPNRGARRITQIPASPAAIAAVVNEQYPVDSPPHPWDQGLNIFPEDHPYRPIERLIQTTHGGPGDQEEERIDFWKTQLKELAP